MNHLKRRWLIHKFTQIKIKHDHLVKDMPNLVQLLPGTVPTKQLKKILLLAKSLLKQIHHLLLK
jgi:hypothetical protein